LISLRRTLATASRILAQLRHDKRTIALMLAVPVFLLVIVHSIFEGRPAVFDRIGLVLLGVLPFTVMFLLTSIAMLRERTTGTLERLLTTPLSKLDLLLGYGLAFALAAAAQSAVASLAAYGLLGLDTLGSPLLVGLIAIANAVLGMALGLFVSAFATSEFQAVQFMPAIVMPQALLCGLFAPRGQMAGWLQTASDFMPMTYAVEALTEVGHNPGVTNAMLVDVGIIVVAALAALALAAATLQRRSG
jgi:ABC-2 type transport system permease protein